jgi:hypothetical protein
MTLESLGWSGSLAVIDILGRRSGNLSPHPRYPIEILLCVEKGAQRTKGSEHKRLKLMALQVRYEPLILDLIAQRVLEQLTALLRVRDHAVLFQGWEISWEAVQIQQRRDTKVAASASQNPQKVLPPATKVTTASAAMPPCVRNDLANDGCGGEHAEGIEVRRQDTPHELLFSLPFDRNNQLHQGRPPITPLSKTSASV